MFPLCLINASVTDAGRIRSRLVSFHRLCHIAFPMVLLKKQTGSDCLFIIFAGLWLFLCLSFLSDGPRKEVLDSRLLAWLVSFHLSTFIRHHFECSSLFHTYGMTQRFQRGSLTSDEAPTGLFSHPEIKPSAAAPLLYCWEHSRTVMKYMQAV